MKSFAISLILVNLTNLVLSERILVLSFFSSKSHKLTYLPLLEELGKRNHSITLLTQIEPSKPLQNGNEILTISWEETFSKMMKNLSAFELKQKKETLSPIHMMPLIGDLCRSSYDLPIIKELLKEKFDLVIMQPIFNECTLGIVYRLKAPLILFSNVGVQNFLVERIGGHLPYSTTPNIFLGFPEEMTFLQRLINFGASLLIDVVMKYYYEPEMTRIYREKLGDDIPEVREILLNTSLILSNGHFSLNGIKPLLPDIVEVGGLHSFVESKMLDKKLEDFIKRGDKGFIYFSMGSVIKASEMPKEKTKMFLDVFSKLEQNVLWKWEGEMDNLPKNVMISKWLPQQDLLGRDEIKLFITHCGGGSVEEAIYNGVPMLGFPMIGDQPGNSKFARSLGIILEMDWNDLDEEGLMRSIMEILNDQSYSENGRRIRELYRDREEKPVDKAVYWVEYVMRHKGAKHLQSAGRNLNWIQYHSFDVILTYLGLIGGTVYMIFGAVRCIVRKICGKRKKLKGD